LIRLLKVGQIALSMLLLGGAIGYVVSQAAWDQIIDATANLSWLALAGVSLLLAAGAILASLRLWYIGRDLGYHLTFREAVSALALGQVAGALFFQVAGQLMARSAFLSRRRVPVAGTVIATGYERLNALAVSLVLAIAAAIYLFGKISINTAEGGLLAITIFLGLSVAIIASASLSWGPLVAKNFPALTANTYRSLARSFVLSLVIQLTTMTAYVVLVLALVPGTPVLSLIAASALIMFSASLPISFAGWGMREMSAIFALGAIGVNAGASLTVAATVGLISLVVVGLLATTAIGHPPKLESAHKGQSTGRVVAIDHAALLEQALSIIVTTAVFFQIFIPLNKGLINVNLADPFVILGGCLFVFNHLGGRWPLWRVPQVNLYFGLITLLIAGSFLYGLHNFGWTDWAFTNRFLGWLVILAYVGTGTLIVNRAGRDGLDLLLHTFAVVATSIVTLELVLLMLNRFFGDFFKPLTQLPFLGFTENRNAFAFQLLLAGCLILAARWKHSATLLSLIMVGILFSGSRAIFITFPIVVVMSAYMHSLKVRTLLISCAITVAIVIFVTYGPMAISFVSQPPRPGDILTVMISSPASNTERLKSLIEGWSMFVGHPIFGAGLGAFMNQSLKEGTPLVIHSTALWLMAEFGLVGLVIFAIPAIHIFWAEARKPMNADAAGVVLVLILTAFVVVSNAHEIMYQRAFWLLLGAALACVPERLARARH
jgi:uncharacterized membrane protein YbhN (UPF0104 family)